MSEFDNESYLNSRATAVNVEEDEPPCECGHDVFAHLYKDGVTLTVCHECLCRHYEPEGRRQ